MYKRRWVRSLGVSTLVANMLMILITLSLAAILVAWAGTSYGSFTGGSQLYFAQRQQALQERFAIEMVFFNKTGSSHTLMVFVRNVGVQQITILAIYVNGTSIQNSMLVSKVCTPTTITATLPTTMPIGAVCEFFVTGYTPIGNAVACTGLQTGQWCSGTLFNFVVASARGNQATYSARGP
jgi:archaellum component FlaF (FlaF/FlaG flagellin family)